MTVAAQSTFRADSSIFSMYPSLPSLSHSKVEVIPPSQLSSRDEEIHNGRNKCLPQNRDRVRGFMILPPINFSAESYLEVRPEQEFTILVHSGSPA